VTCAFNEARQRNVNPRYRLELLEADAASIILRMLNPEDHRALAERCVRLAQECSRPGVTQYLMALAANYLEVAELTGGVRRPLAPVVRLDRVQNRCLCESLQCFEG
jgi:hypothetical protein